MLAAQVLGVSSKVVYYAVFAAVVCTWVGYVAVHLLASRTGRTARAERADRNHRA